MGELYFEDYVSVASWLMERWIEGGAVQGRMERVDREKKEFYEVDLLERKVAHDQVSRG